MNKRLLGELILSLPKTIFFNFRAFDLKMACKLPIWISFNTKLGGVHKGVIKLNNWDSNHYKILFGFSGSEHIIPNKYSYLSFGKSASIIFEGNANFAKGCAFRCDYGRATFGREFSANRNCTINCEYEMNFGAEVLFGWNVNIRDTDGHQVFESGEQKISQKCVNVGNHVWICSYSDVLKGVSIGNDVVVAWKSCVVNSINGDNILIGGSPAKILKRNINWIK